LIVKAALSRLINSVTGILMRNLFNLCEGEISP